VKTNVNWVHFLQFNFLKVLIVQWWYIVLFILTWSYASSKHYSRTLSGPFRKKIRITK
jgi:hypothetical protein